jgi:ABC-type lipoprotein export system ATPase subunit
MDPESAPNPGILPSEADTLSAEIVGTDGSRTFATDTEVISTDGISSNGISPNGIGQDSTGVRPVVELRSLTRTYGSDPPVHALRGVDLKIQSGEWVAIVGPSGSGKSTLLNILGCLDRPTSGSYHVDGIDTALLSDEERATFRATNIGFVFQTFHLLGHRTAVENVMLADVYAGGDRTDRRERALASLEKVRIAHRSEHLPTKLSGGEQQRVAIARALLGSPKLLLCDEPTGNLDTVNTESVMSLFEELGEGGLTLIVITHDDHVAERAKRIVRIIDGHLNEVTE